MWWHTPLNHTHWLVDPLRIDCKQLQYWPVAITTMAYLYRPVVRRGSLAPVITYTPYIVRLFPWSLWKNRHAKTGPSVSCLDPPPVMDYNIFADEFREKNWMFRVPRIFKHFYTLQNLINSILMAYHVWQNSEQRCFYKVSISLYLSNTLLASIKLCNNTAVKKRCSSWH